MTLQTTAMPLTTAIASSSASALTGADASGGADARSSATLFLDILDKVDAEVDRREQSKHDKPQSADDAMSDVNPQDTPVSPAFRAASGVGDSFFALATARAAVARDALPREENDRDQRKVTGALDSAIAPTNQQRLGPGREVFPNVEHAPLGRQAGAQATVTRLIEAAYGTAQETLSSDAPIVAGGDEEKATELSEVASPALNANPRLTIAAFETHLPIAVAHAFSQRDAAPIGAPPIAPSMFDVNASQPEAAPLKILTFTLEPEALGAVTVKMRVMRLSVDIEIDVGTAKTQFLLNELKDRLAAAIDAGGVAVEAIDIRISSAPDSSDMRQPHDESRSGHAPMSGSRSGEDAFADGGEFSRPHKARASTPARRLREQNTHVPDHDRDRTRGVYL